MKLLQFVSFCFLVLLSLRILDANICKRHHCSHGWCIQAANSRTRNQTPCFWPNYGAYRVYLGTVTLWVTLGTWSTFESSSHRQVMSSPPHFLPKHVAHPSRMWPWAPASSSRRGHFEVLLSPRHQKWTDKMHRNET